MSVEKSCSSILCIDEKVALQNMSNVCLTIHSLHTKYDKHLIICVSFKGLHKKKTDLAWILIPQRSKTVRCKPEDNLDGGMEGHCRHR